MSDNSGVFIRFSDPGADPWNAVKTGYEIQIDDLTLPNGRAEHKTGAIYDIACYFGFKTPRRMEYF